MGEESLRELLGRLHERLSASGSVEGEARALLDTVMRDIERALGSLPPAAGAATLAPAHVPRLESLAVQFETGHPALAAHLRRLIDALGQAGI
jgi:predicted component of type VI protein secretion system